MRIFPAQTENLRPENWASLSLSERVSTLNALETALATEQGREPSRVDVLPPERCSSHEEWLNTRGLYEPGELLGNGNRNPGTILVNPGLLEPSQAPYMATETLYHEATHAYQQYIADHPDLAEDPEKAKITAMNCGEGYLTPTEDGYELYAMQPNERDATESARQLTDEIFSDQLRDPEGYSDHVDRREAEIADNELRAELMLGPEYEGLVEQAVQDKYRLAMEQEQEATRDRDQDYTYGYGY